LLTGHPPFPDGTQPPRLLAHQIQQPRPIAAHRHDVPDELLRICDRMRAKSPKDRPQSGIEVRQMRQNFLIKYCEKHKITEIPRTGAKPAPFVISTAETRTPSYPPTLPDA